MVNPSLEGAATPPARQRPRGYVQWRPTRDRGAAGVLTLDRNDGPELDSNVPRLLAFKKPLLEDP